MAKVLARVNLQPLIWTLRMPPEVSEPMPMQAKMESAKVQLVMVTSSVVMSGLRPICEGLRRRGRI